MMFKYSARNFKFMGFNFYCLFFKTLFAQNQTFWFLCEQCLKCSHSLGTLGKKLVTVLLLILDIAKYINSEATASYNSIADKTYGYFLTILAGTHKKVKMFLEPNSIWSKSSSLPTCRASGAFWNQDLRNINGSHWQNL